jgi:hypothetical protein
MFTVISACAGITEETPSFHFSNLSTVNVFGIIAGRVRGCSGVGTEHDHRTIMASGKKKMMLGSKLRPAAERDSTCRYNKKPICKWNEISVLLYRYKY